MHFYILQIKGISSGETTRSRNSASCSIERTISEKGQAPSQGGQGRETTAKTTLQYVNERRPRPHAQGSNASTSAGGAGDERFEFKTRPRKLLKGKFDERSKFNYFSVNVPRFKDLSHCPAAAASAEAASASRMTHFWPYVCHTHAHTLAFAIKLL